jgi:hypothetical protein
MNKTASRLKPLKGEASAVWKLLFSRDIPNILSKDRAAGAVGAVTG